MKTISARLTLALCMLLLCTICLAIVAWINQAQKLAALHALYEDSIAPVTELKAISDRFAIRIVDAAHRARGGLLMPEDARKSVGTALTEINQFWSAFRLRPHRADEQKLVDDVHRKVHSGIDSLRKIEFMLAANDLVGLNMFVQGMMYQTVEPAIEGIDALIAFQLTEAREIRDAAEQADRLARYNQIAISILAIATCLGAIVFFLRGVMRPLRQSVVTMQTLAEATVGSKLTGEARLHQLEAVSIDGTERPDEIGDMARTLVTFRETGIERLHLRIASETELAERQARTERVDALVRDFDAAAATIIATIATSSQQLEASAQSMAGIARETSQQSWQVARTSEEISGSAATLAANGDELALSITEIAKQAEQSSLLATHASQKATLADATAARLGEAGSAIAEVVDLIRSIAAQTNLLALNATIEAARAGDAGRGFAVVAAEVKDLAGQTTRATEVIADHVGAIQSASGQTIEALGDIGRMIGDITQVASAIAVAVTEQGQATRGIADNVQQMARGAEEASLSIGTVNEADAAGQVLAASEELSRQSQFMREKVDAFLAGVRAA
jgi:methyl-accepting chemotaxis protein